SDPPNAAVRRRAYDVLRAQPETLVLHLEGGWGVTMSMLLEGDRDGFDLRVAERDLWAFPGGLTPRAGERVRHVWFAEPHRDPAPPAVRCLTPIAALGEITILGAPEDIVTCPE